MSDGVKIIIGGHEIAAMQSMESRDCLVETMEYYMRRGDKIYFRGVTGKLIVSASNLDIVLSEIKYGDRVKVKIS